MFNTHYKARAATLLHAAMLLALGAPATVLAAQHGAHPKAAGAAAASTQGKYIERGRYLVRVGGCNDCHTPGYGMNAGKLPEKEWLTGDQLGWRGPWGTTYPANLRLSMNAMNEDDWITMAKTARTRPPMPWFTLHEMEKEDLRAIYRFVRHLGPAGKPAPAYVPPERMPAGPAVQFPMPPK
jgi:mono/diheme cytochrome c family protein